MRVSNIDTLSAYFDRLISERIKLYHFETKYKDKDGMEHQQKVVDEIKLKILDIFIECLENSKYDYVGENKFSY